jgi:glucosylceramidase
MIQDFNNGTVDIWNVLLDQNGGPNHVGNFCFHHFMETRTGFTLRRTIILVTFQNS